MSFVQIFNALVAHMHVDTRACVKKVYYFNAPVSQQHDWVVTHFSHPPNRFILVNTT